MEYQKSVNYSEISALPISSISDVHDSEYISGTVDDMNNSYFSFVGTYPAHQYSKTYHRDFLPLNTSCDLYGSGGLRSATKDLTLFFQQNN